MPKYRQGQLVVIYKPEHPFHNQLVQIIEISFGKSMCFYHVKTAKKKDFVFDEIELREVKDKLTTIVYE